MHRRTFLLLLCLGTALTLSAQTKRPIRETDLYDFRWIADARISPDGSKVVYTIVKVNAKHDGYDTAGFERTLVARWKDPGFSPCSG
jgi:hypothetical protein